MVDFELCPCSGATLDKLIRPAILSVLTAGSLHGYRLVEKLAELRIARGARPDATGIYRALHSMQEDGFVTARWDTKTGGPARRLYRLTSRGRQCLRRWVGTLAEYDAALRQLLATARRATRPARPGGKARA